jgi:aminoglycoside phosphotransferase (APT) family kinase protein
MLTQSQVAHYMLRENFVSPERVVDCDLTVTEATSRNRNFMVLSERGPSYLLKQGTDANGVETVAHESRMYRFFHEVQENEAFRRFIPRFVKYDASRKILVLELLRKAQDFQECHIRRGRFSVSLSAMLGKALSMLHRIPAQALKDAPASAQEKRTPWALEFDRPPAGFIAEASHAGLQIFRIVQNAPGFGALLAELRADWRCDALTHNDIKWSNCLIHPGTGVRQRPELKIIDWEFARPGDACWDTGAVFSAYLSSWVQSIPVSGREPPDRFFDLARYPLEGLQPAIRSFWNAYAKWRNFNASEAENHLVRAVKYSATRLIQSSYEQMQYSPTLTGNVVCMLQLSLNILQRPAEAIVHLLGLPLNQSLAIRHA